MECACNFFVRTYNEREGALVEKTKANREHKDRLFKKIFSDKETLLELYNAVNDTAYTNAEDIEVDAINGGEGLWTLRKAY